MAQCYRNSGSPKNGMVAQAHRTSGSFAPRLFTHRLIPHFYCNRHACSRASSKKCQCPLGLIPHFYAIKYSGTVYIKVAGCQCPLGLIPHFYNDRNDHEAFWNRCVNALSGLYLISTGMSGRKDIFIDFVSMPSRAYTSFLRYPFRNLGFMRFPEPVFAGIYQNILTTAIFRAC